MFGFGVVFVFVAEVGLGRFASGEAAGDGAGCGAERDCGGVSGRESLVRLVGEAVDIALGMSGGEDVDSEECTFTAEDVGLAEEACEMVGLFDAGLSSSRETGRLRRSALPTTQGILKFQCNCSITSVSRRQLVLTGGIKRSHCSIPTL